MRKFGKIRDLWRATYGACLGVVAVAAVITFTSFGRYVDEEVFLQPAFAGAYKLGFGPQLASQLRFVLLDDRSLSLIGRVPTFADWNDIASLLMRQGYQRVLLSDIFSLPTEIGALGAPPSAPVLATGVVSYPREGSLRARPAGDVPATTLIGSDGSIASLPEAIHVIGASPAIERYVAAFGLLNAGRDLVAPMALRVGDHGVIPALGLLAAPSLRWRDGALWSGTSRLPHPSDGMLVVDYVPMERLTRAALPASAFFDHGAVATSLSADVVARLQGGTVAMLVPQASTGGRFLSTPLGPMPSYSAIAAIANGVLTGRLPYRPLPSPPLVMAIAFLAGLVIVLARPLVATIALAVGTLVAVGSGVTLLASVAIVLPAGEIATVLGLASAVAALRLYMHMQFAQASTAREFELGREVQAALLPERQQGVCGPWEWAVVFQPLGALSGDWFHVYVPPESRPGEPVAVLAIGDAVGKGASAALCTASITTLWNQERQRWLRGEGVDVDSFLQRFHEGLFQTFSGRQFTSLSLAVLFEDRVETIVAGAPLWVRVSPTRVQRVVARTANPVGMDGASESSLLSLTLGDGELLLAHTDGVADGPAGQRAFNDAVGAAQAAGALTQERLATIGHDLRTRYAQADDFTILMIRRVSRDAGSRLDPLDDGARQAP